LERSLNVSRKTATNYLNSLTADGFLHKQKSWRDVYYINTALFEILTEG